MRIALSVKTDSSILVLIDSSILVLIFNKFK